MTHMSNTRLRRNQSGMVSIMVTMVMMVVITLIVLGFAQVVRRNAREALDRQLSTQAYYAAETGINDVYARYLDFLSNPGNTNEAVTAADGTTCNSYTDRNDLGKNVLDVGDQVFYTCVTVKNSAKSIPVLVPNDGTAKSVSLQMNQPPGSLQFTWQAGKAVDGSHNKTTCPSNYVPNDTGAGDWLDKCPYGVLRLDLFAPSQVASNDADGATAATVSVFFVPPSFPFNNGTNPLVAFNASGQEVYKVKASCDDAAATCTGSIQVPAAAGNNFYARLSSVYESAGTVTIRPGSPGTTFNGFITVDSTGKAQDEVRRVQVLIPANQASDYPITNNAINSGNDVCKRFLTAPTIYTVNCSNINTKSELEGINSD